MKKLICLIFAAVMSVCVFADDCYVGECLYLLKRDGKGLYTNTVFPNDTLKRISSGGGCTILSGIDYIDGEFYKLNFTFIGCGDKGFFTVPISYTTCVGNPLVFLDRHRKK